MQVAEVIPIYKTGYKQIIDQCHSFLKRFDSFVDKQSVWLQKQQSTASAVTDLPEEITECIDNKSMHLQCF